MDTTRLAEHDTGLLDEAVSDLNNTKDTWARLTIGAKIGYLDRIRPRLAEVAEEWVAAAVHAKEIRP